jgi:serine/threonine protein kinase
MGVTVSRHGQPSDDASTNNSINGVLMPKSGQLKKPANTGAFMGELVLPLMAVRLHSVQSRQSSIIINNTMEDDLSSTSSPSPNKLRKRLKSSLSESRLPVIAVPKRRDIDDSEADDDSIDSFRISRQSSQFKPITKSNSVDSLPSRSRSVSPTNSRNAEWRINYSSGTDESDNEEDDEKVFREDYLLDNMNLPQSLPSPSTLAFKRLNNSNGSPNRKPFANLLHLDKEEDTLLDLRRNSSPSSPILVNLPWCRTNGNQRRHSNANRFSPLSVGSSSPDSETFSDYNRSPQNSRSPINFDSNSPLSPYSPLKLVANEVRNRSINMSRSPPSSVAEMLEKRMKSTSISIPTRKDFNEVSKAEIGVDDKGRKTLNQYSITRFLGKGQYGKVKLCSVLHSDDLVAIKIIDKSILKDARKTGLPFKMELHAVKQEVAILKALDHPNIVKLKEVIDDPENYKIYLVFEYIDGGELIEVKMDGSVESEPMEEEKASNYFKQLLNGLEYLHHNQIVHRDIKPSNLLVTRDGLLKISDFGVSRLFSGNDDSYLESQGTPAFLPPEACGAGGVIQGRSADIWAAGVTLYAMIFGQVPFKGEGIGPGKLFSLYQSIMHDSVQLPFDVSPELKDLFRLIFAKDPANRISLQDLQIHPWVINEQLPIGDRPRRNSFLPDVEKEEQKKREMEIQRVTNRATVVVTDSDVQNAIREEANYKLVDKFAMLVRLKGKMAEKRRKMKLKGENSSSPSSSPDSSIFNSSSDDETSPPIYSSSKPREFRSISAT